jgi:hypothetical protein
VSDLCLSRDEIRELTPFDGWLDPEACAYYLGMPAGTDVAALPDFPEPNEDGRRSVLEVHAWADRDHAKRRTALYRHYDAKGRLLYVGISLSALARLRQHQERSSWANAITRVTIEWHPSREVARAAEKRAIREERPIHNKQDRRR